MLTWKEIVPDRSDEPTGKCVADANPANPGHSGTASKPYVEMFPPPPPAAMSFPQPVTYRAGDYRGGDQRIYVRRNMYDYAPSIMYENGRYRMWWCASVPTQVRVRLEVAMICWAAAVLCMLSMRLTDVPHAQGGDHIFHAVADNIK